MAFSVSQMLYRLFGNRVQATVHTGAIPTQIRTARPQGQLVWLHVPNSRNHGVVADLVSGIADIYPDFWFLLTTEGEPMLALPDQAIFQTFLADRPITAREFVAHWQPDLAIWLSDHLLPTLIHEISRRSVPLVLLDTGSAFETTKRIWFLPRLIRRTLRMFDALLSSDEATTLALISAGARGQNVQTTGALEQTVTPPPCNEAEWTTLAKLMATRPVWLAVHIQLSDLESVLTAHMQATRRSHRLLLIISPADPTQTAEFRALLGSRNIAYAIRSEGEEPDNITQVYLADTDDEIGLWYRLAPVCFIGKSNVQGAQPEPNPLEAASLGSVVLHNPGPSTYDVAYRRLERAGASRPIAHLGELAHALETILAPDRAAVMAHSAWQITSAGAEAREAALGVISEILDANPRTDK